MVTATALKLTLTTGQFRPEYHGHFPPEQVVTLFRNQVVNISETSKVILNICPAEQRKPNIEKLIKKSKTTRHDLLL